VRSPWWYIASIKPHQQLCAGEARSTNAQSKQVAGQDECTIRGGNTQDTTRLAIEFQSTKRARAIASATQQLFDTGITMTTPRVAGLLEDIRRLNEDRFVLVQALRQLVLGLDPVVSEEVKYGGLLFSAGKPFCGVFAYAKHVSLEFGEGASLPDAHQVLEGEGKFRRHIKLVNTTDLPAKHVQDYLVLAFKKASAP
jgi:hypothetical protein